MAAIGTQAAQELIDRAAAVGITERQIAEQVGLRVDALEVMSGRNRDQVERTIAAAEERQRLLDRAAHLATLSGYDARTIRGKISGYSTSQLKKLAADSERHLRGKGIDTRTEAEKQAAAAAPATDAQVGYIMDLLHRRVRSGEGGGYVSTKGLVDENGRPQCREIARLTKSQASQLIDSLRSDY